MSVELLCADHDEKKSSSLQLRAKRPIGRIAECQVICGFILWSWLAFTAKM